jgi:hypothetical protein
MTTFSVLVAIVLPHLTLVMRQQVVELPRGTLVQRLLGADLKDLLEYVQLR